MGRRRDAERTNNGSDKRLSLYLDVNWKIRWTYSSWNYVNNFTTFIQQGHIKLIKSDSKDIYNATTDF